MSRRSISGIFALLALVAGAAGCAPDPGPPPVDRVVLVVVDTLRADAVGCYGGQASTPNMDRLAAEGLRFANARSHIPITGPSHSTLFTSRWPAEHGVRNNTQILGRELPTLAELLRDHGCRTAGFVSLGVLKAKFGLDRGFETYVDDFGLNWFRDAADLNRDVLSWLAQEAPERGFLWVHYSDPHEPYAPPDEVYPKIRVMADAVPVAELVADGRRQSVSVPLTGSHGQIRFEAGSPAPGDGELVTLVGGSLTANGRLRHGRGLFPWFEDQERYDYVTALPAVLQVEVDDPSLSEVGLRFGVALKLSPEQSRQAYLREVEYADRAIGELLAALEAAGWLERSLVVLTADHGEGLGDHNLMGHIHQLYDSLLHVPLILWAPGAVPAGKVDERPVGLVDILPTVLRAAGVAPPAGIRGRDLLQSGEAAPLLAQTFKPEARNDMVAMVNGSTKIILRPRDQWLQLYDLAADPRELHDLGGAGSAAEERLLRLLQEALAAAVSRDAASATLDAETEEQLRALGYLH